MSTELAIQEFSQKLQSADNDQITEALRTLAEVISPETVRNGYREIPEGDRWGWD